MDGLFSREELTRWRRVVRSRLFVFGRPPSERRRKRLAGQPGGARGGRRRSGASVVAAWLSPSVGACGVGVLLARRCPGKRHGAFAAPPAPHRPQTLPARLCEAARPAPRPMYGRERRRGRAPSEGHFPARSAWGAGAREWSGCASLRVAALGLRALSREASRGFAPQSRGGDAQQPGGGEGRVRAARTFCGKSGAMHADRVCIAPKTGENVRERQTKEGDRAFSARSPSGVSVWFVLHVSLSACASRRA